MPDLQNLDDSCLLSAAENIPPCCQDSETGECPQHADMTKWSTQESYWKHDYRHAQRTFKRTIERLEDYTSTLT